MRLLGLDPGWASFGWAVVERNDLEDLRELRVVAIGLIATELEADAATVAGDEHRRGNELGRALWNLQAMMKPDAIAVETFTHPIHRSKACATCRRPPINVKTVGQHGRAFGALDAVAAIAQLPIIQVHARTIRKRVVGHAKGVSKADVHERLLELHARRGTWWRDWQSSGARKSDREHPLDALGAAVASLEDSRAFEVACRADAGP